MSPEEDHKELEFKDVAKLVNRDIQLILREVSGKDIAIALKGADEDLRDRIFGNVSKRMATVIRDEMKLSAAVKIHEVQETRSLITTIARGLASTGAITWPPSAAPLRPLEDQPPKARKPASVKPVQKKRISPMGLLRMAGGLASVAALILAAVFLGRVSKPDTQDSDEAATASKPSQSSTTAPATSVADVQKSRSNSGDQPRQSESAGAAQPAEGSAQSRAGESDAEGRSGDARGAGGAAEELKPGTRIETTSEAPVTYEMWDGSGTVQVEPNTTLEVGEPDEKVEEPPKMDLRLGNVQVHVKDPALEVTSPLVKVTATEGAKYRIRVVMDATTTVTVESGVVWARPTVGQGARLMALQPGDVVRISPSGRVVMSKTR